MINFYKLRIHAFILSIALILISLWFVVGVKNIDLGYATSKGFNLGIDFQGGLVHQVTIYTGISQDKIRELSMKSGLGSEVQRVIISEKNQITENQTSYLIKTIITKEEQEQIDNDPKLTPVNFLENRMKDFYSMIIEETGKSTFILKGNELKKTDENNKNTLIPGEIADQKTDDQRVLQNVVTESTNTISPAYSAGLRLQVILLIIFVLCAMLIYISFRFKFKYAIGAILALTHDTLIILGFVTLFQLEVDYSIVAAILFIMGYSINDTIVIYDRIRENYNIMKESSSIEIMNVSINQTLKRTIITSLTTLLAILALLFFGGPKIHGFSLTVTVGLFFGTYSSIFIASPIVLFWERLFLNKKTRIKEIKKEEKAYEREKKVETKPEEEKTNEISENTQAQISLSKKQLKKFSGKKKKR
jgi:preprotein translocase subunit SecF